MPWQALEFLVVILDFIELLLLNLTEFRSPTTLFSTVADFFFQA